MRFATTGPCVIHWLEDTRTGQRIRFDKTLADGETFEYVFPDGLFYGGEFPAGAGVNEDGEDIPSAVPVDTRHGIEWLDDKGEHHVLINADPAGQS